MIFAFYPSRIGDGCGFWERKINISSRLQLCMHGRRARKLESNSSTRGLLARRGAEKAVITLSQCVCLLSSIKPRPTLETVNYVIIAGREVTPGELRPALWLSEDCLAESSSTRCFARERWNLIARHRAPSSRIMDRP